MFKTSPKSLALWSPDQPPSVLPKLSARSGATKVVVFSAAELLPNDEVISVNGLTGAQLTPMFQLLARAHECHMPICSYFGIFPRLQKVSG